jgi:hypothetical protein
VSEISREGKREKPLPSLRQVLPSNRPDGAGPDGTGTGTPWKVSNTSFEVSNTSYGTLSAGP